MDTEFASNPWFRSLSASDAQALLDVAQPLYLERGSVLFRKDDRVLPHQGCLYGLVRGTLKASSLHVSGKEAFLML